MPPANNNQTPTQPVVSSEHVVPAFMSASSASGAGSPPTPPSSPSVIAQSPSRKSFNRKTGFALAGIVVLIMGMAVSLGLVMKQRNLYQVSAWQCAKYTFNVSQTGEVTVSYGADASRSSEAAQNAVVSINGTPVATLSVPAIQKGQTLSIGKVQVPTAQGFSWEVQGQSDCKNSGVYPPQSTSCTVKFTESDKLYCERNAGKVTVTGTVVSAPAGATLEKSWHIVEPYSTETQYSTEPVSSGKTFSITADWPGIKSSDTLVEIHFGFNMRDANGNLIANCNGGLDYYWTKDNAGACPGVTPTKTPAPTPTKTPTPKPTATPTTKPTATPTKTPTPTPTPSGRLVCNSDCTSNTQCDTNYCYQGKCRNQNNPSNTQCIVPTNTPTPTSPSSPTNTPTNTPAPTTPPTSGNPNSCGGTCGSDANCQPGLTCYLGFCRNPNNPSDSNCNNKTTTTATSTPTPKTIAINNTPTPVKELPESGAADYTFALLGAAGLLLSGGFVLSRKIA